MKHNLKRLTALLLAMAMAMSLLCTSAWAAEVDAADAADTSAADVVAEEIEEVEDGPAEEVVEPELAEEESAEEDEEPEALNTATSGTCGDNLTWTFSNGTLTISGTGDMTDWPYSLGSSYVPWSSSLTSITSIVIEDGVTSIGEYAFADCTSLTNVTIPDSVTSIGDSAFYNCSNLTSVTIPDSVTSISGDAFTLCYSLTSIVVNGNNEKYSSQDGALFNKNKTTLICYPAGSNSSSYTIPNSVTSIGGAAFWHCSSLTSVTIPDSVTSIGWYAFQYCSSLTTVKIPSSVTSISGAAFRFCSNLTSVEIPDSVTSIESFAFYGCTSLTDIYYSGSGEEWSAISIGSDNTYLTNATIHYNSTGPDSTGSEDGNGTLTFDEDSYSCNVDDTVSITAIYVSETAPTEDHITWTCSDENAVTFSGTSTQGPSVTGVENTYWISVQATATTTGEYDITLDVDGVSASVPLKSGTNSEPISGTGLTANFVFPDSTISVEAGVIPTSNKVIAWENGAYTSKEITALLTLKYNAKAGEEDSTATVSKIAFSLDNLDMFKIDGDAELTPDIQLASGESYSCEVKLVKNGWFWKKPDSSSEQTGTITAVIEGTQNDKDVSLNKQATIRYWNEDLKQSEQDEAEKAEQEAKEEAEKAAKKDAESAVDEFANLENALALDPQISSKEWLGSDAGKALEVLIYSEISLASMSKDTWKEAGNLSDQVVEKIFNKYLGNWQLKTGTSTKELPFSAIFLNDSNQQIQCNVTCKVNGYTLNSSLYGITAWIDITLTNLSTGKTQSFKDNLLAQADIQTFADAAWDVASAELKSGYKKVWASNVEKEISKIVEGSVDSLASKVAAYGLEEPVKVILKTYYKEKLKSKFSDYTFKLLTYPSKLVVAHCPVDLYIYNSENTLVGSIEGDEVTLTGDNLALWTEGDDKYAQLFDNTYTIQYKSTGTGTMTLDVYDQANGLTDIRVCTYKNVPLEVGLNYNETVNDEILTVATNYDLTSNKGNTITATSVSYFEDENSSDNNTGNTDDNSSGGSGGTSVHTHTAGEAVKENEVPATATEAGSYDSVVYCTVCKAEISRTKVIVPATGDNNGTNTDPVAPAKSPANAIEVSKANASNVVKTTYSKAKQTFSLGVTALDGAALTYSSSNSKVKVSSAGNVTIPAKFIGTATITITAAATDHYAETTQKITVKVTPTKTTLKSVTNVKGKKMTVKWKKNTVGTGYQIQYSTSKTFAKSNKTVTIKKKATTSKTISGLKKGKTYYVRVRTYKTVNGKKIYSAWSTVKAIRNVK